MQRATQFVTAISLLLLAHPTHAIDGPLRIRNASPASQIFGLPRALGGEILPPDHELTFNTEVANVFTSDVDDTSFAFFDGETVTMTAGYRRRLGRRFEMGIEVPYVIHHGGRLDRVIDEFHDLFGLPQGGRDQAQRNKIDYVIRSGGTTYIDFQDSKESLGDIRIAGGFGWLREADRALALRASLKLPTGDADKLTGSDGADLAVWLDFTDRRWLSRLGLELTMTGGVLLMEEGEIVPEDQNDVALFGHLGLSYPISARWTLKAQLDGHTELIGTGLDQASGEALQGSIGTRFAPGGKFWMDIALSEDLVSDSSPDVVIQLLLGARF
jgi:hypothetical protein